MAQFEPGKSGNPNGRPTKAEQALRRLNKTDLDTVLRKLKRASPEAVNLIIQAMNDPEVPKRDRLKYAKEVFDMFTKAVSLDSALKKAQNVDSPAEEPAEAQPDVVFRIVS